jgi:hypothetical protein
MFFELRQEFEKRRIHLADDLCSELDQCIKALWEPTVAAGVWAGVNNPEYSQEQSQAYKKAMIAVIQSGAVEVAIANVEGHFANRPASPAAGAVSRRG